jgi:hypothetical protein
MALIGTCAPPDAPPYLSSRMPDEYQTSLGIRCGQMGAILVLTDNVLPGLSASMVPTASFSMTPVAMSQPVSSVAEAK